MNSLEKGDSRLLTHRVPRVESSLQFPSLYLNDLRAHKVDFSQENDRLAYRELHV